MKLNKYFFILFLLLFYIFPTNARAIRLIRIIKCNNEIIFWDNSDYLISIYDANKLFQKDGNYEFYLYTNNKLSCLYKFYNKYYAGIFCATEGKHILKIANERDFSKRGINLIENIYEINEMDFSYYELSDYKHNYKNKVVPSLLHDIYYDTSYAYAKINNYYLIASDVLDHGIEINAEAPEKHAYHDMDLCLIDNQGNTCAVLPFTVDDQTAMDKSILESSPNGNLVKIKASSSYFYAKINDNLLEKYPELQNGLFYFIYEISNDQTSHKVEYIDMSSEFNLEEGKEIDVKYENNEYSCFDIKVLDNHIKKESAIQKKSKWWED